MLNFVHFVNITTWWPFGFTNIVEEGRGRVFISAYIGKKVVFCKNVFSRSFPRTFGLHCSLGSCYLCAAYLELLQVLTRLTSPSCSVIRCIVQKELVMMNIETELVPKCFGNFGRMVFFFRLIIQYCVSVQLTAYIWLLCLSSWLNYLIGHLVCELHLFF